jgi:chemotaxis response regulator CheB
MATKRVILANGSRLLREMLHHVLDQAEHLEVVQEIREQEELSPFIERLNPQWVILTSRAGETTQPWLEDYIARHPSVRFIFVSPDHQRIELRSHASAEQDLANLSLSDFVHILERDSRHS